LISPCINQHHSNYRDVRRKGGASWEGKMRRRTPLSTSN
jgi:hypothetical protein